MITFGSHTFTSPDLQLTGLKSGKTRFIGQQFLDGGFRAYHGQVSGQQLTLLSILDTTRDDADRFMGVIRWADIIALRAMAGASYTMTHPLITRLGEQVIASLDNTSLDALTYYDLGGHGEPINPDIDTCYPGTDLLLGWYGPLNFTRTN